MPTVGPNIPGRRTWSRLWCIKLCGNIIEAVINQYAAQYGAGGWPKAAAASAERSGGAGESFPRTVI